MHFAGFYFITPAPGLDWEQRTYACVPLLLAAHQGRLLARHGPGTGLCALMGSPEVKPMASPLTLLAGIQCQPPGKIVRDSIYPH